MLFSNDFGIGEADGEEQSPDATYIWSGGRFTIEMKRTQTTATARRFVSAGDQRDFVLTFDTRLTNQADQAGIIVVFRHVANTGRTLADAVVAGRHRDAGAEEARQRQHRQRGARGSGPGSTRRAA